MDSKVERMRGAEVVHRTPPCVIVGVPVLGSAGGLSNPGRCCDTPYLAAEVANHSDSEIEEGVEGSKSEVPTANPASSANPSESEPDLPAVEPDSLAAESEFPVDGPDLPADALAVPEPPFGTFAA